MCGRIVQATSPEEIAREFGADLSVGVRESLSAPAIGDTSLVRAGWYPRWNMAPSSRIVMVAPAAGESRVVEYGRWGLVPAWQKARTGHVSGLFNARAETVAQLPSFKEAYLPSAGAHLTLGGITTEYGGERTLSLVTTQANATVGRIHDRMPVMLRDDAARSIWLDGGAHLDDVAALLGPAPEEYLVPRRVSRLVSNARNEGPECLAEAGVEGLGLV
jgi:putative SOS response-associated peptidase YedK